MQRLDRKIQVAPGTEVSSVWLVPEAAPRRALVLAHGAGNDMHAPLLCFVHERLAARGLLSVKFNFPYKERGGKAPDRAPVLEATWRAVLAAVRGHLPAERIVLAGKSMGGRMASHLAAQGEACAGLIFLGYPLHSARQPQKLRAEQLARIGVPMLFVQGTRDALCDLALFEPILARLTAPVRLHRIEQGDHSFELPKRAGRGQEEVWREIVDVMMAFIEECS